MRPHADAVVDLRQHRGTGSLAKQALDHLAEFLQRFRFVPAFRVGVQELAKGSLARGELLVQRVKLFGLTVEFFRLLFQLLRLGLQLLVLLRDLLLARSQFLVAGLEVC